MRSSPSTDPIRNPAYCWPPLHDARLLRFLLASTVARAVKFDQTGAAMQQAVEENPHSAEVQFRFAEPLCKAARPGEALAYHAHHEEAALENKPSPVEERRIRELLSSLNG